MAWLLGVLLAAALIWLGFLSRRIRALKESQADLQRQLGVVGELAAAVAGADWQRTIPELSQLLLRVRAGRAVQVFRFTQRGDTELLAEAKWPGDPPWEKLADEGARRAQETGTPQRTARGDLYLPIAPEGDEVQAVLAIRVARERTPVIDAAVQLMALALAAQSHNQKQAALSTTDGLTGLTNHRHFQQALGVALGQAYLEGEELCLILLDIDHFKSVNDTHGHLVGDLVLRELAYLLRRELPAGAIAARYGGEEMAVILQGQEAQSAAEIAERLRAVVCGHEFYDSNSGVRLKVTISLGLAHYQLGQGKSRLIARADEALYTSKREGRNRVTAAVRESDTSHPFPA